MEFPGWKKGKGSFRKTCHFHEGYTFSRTMCWVKVIKQIKHNEIVTSDGLIGCCSGRFAFFVTADTCCFIIKWLTSASWPSQSCFPYRRRRGPQLPPPPPPLLAVTGQSNTVTVMQCNLYNWLYTDSSEWICMSVWL